jgi:flagellar motor switch protein FliG
MASPTDRFTRLQKIAIFLIVMGEDKAREILGDLDLDTIESINTAMHSLKDITPQEKAATMIEFGDFFYKDKPLSAQINKPQAKKAPSKKQTPAAQAPSVVSLADLDEKTIAATLSKLKDKIDPGKIDWGKAGYDFGEGFGGSSKRPR